MNTLIFLRMNMRNPKRNVGFIPKRPLFKMKPYSDKSVTVKNTYFDGKHEDCVGFKQIDH